MRKLTPEEREAVLADLRAGLPYAVITQKYDMQKQAVSRIAVRAGLRRMEHKGLLGDVESAAIVARYQAGETSSAIAASLHISDALVLNTLWRAGVKARTQLECHTKLPLRHDALDMLTPDAAYWLGFIFTDGTVNHTRNQSPTVAIVLKKADRNHLVKFRDFLGSEHTITPIKPAAVKINPGAGTGACRFAVRSQQLAGRIEALGRYGPVVDPELAASRDFWRGCVDGDGTVGIWSGIPQVKLVGSKWLMQAYVDFLGPVGSRRPLHPRPAKTIFVVSTSYVTAEKVADRLYTGAATALDRKAAAAAQILDMARARDEGKPWQGSLWPDAGLGHSPSVRV